MAEYIEREALLKRLKFKMETDTTYNHAKYRGLDSAMAQVRKASAVDVVEVVRCKDCKHWDCYGGEDSHKGDCNELVGLDSCMYEGDFCSYGERKENG